MPRLYACPIYRAGTSKRLAPSLRVRLLVGSSVCGAEWVLDCEGPGDGDEAALRALRFRLFVQSEQSEGRSMDSRKTAVAVDRSLGPSQLQDIADT
jgi:hypothetical protein